MVQRGYLSQNIADLAVRELYHAGAVNHEVSVVPHVEVPIRGSRDIVVYGIWKVLAT